MLASLTRRVASNLTTTSGSRFFSKQASTEILEGPAYKVWAGTGVALGVTLGSLTAIISDALINGQSASAQQAEPILGMNSEEWRPFTLDKKAQVSHDSAIYRFRLQSPEHELGLPVASFILAKADIDGEEKPVMRPYTPITYDEKGFFELMVKSYPDGKLSKYVSNMEVGDKLEMKGPMKKMPYTPNMKKTIGMVAGGSGITPMLQVIHKILSNPEDKTDIHLVFANKTYDDILLHDRLEEIAKNHANFHVHYTLSVEEPQNWTGSVGHVTTKMLKKHIPAASKDSMVFVCGPPGFMKAVSGPKGKNFTQGEVSGILKELGWDKSNVYKF